MTKVTITLDEQQVARLDQIIMDRDTEAALKLIKEIAAKAKIGAATCDPISLRVGGAAEIATRKTK